MNAIIFGIFQIFKKPWVFVITTVMLTIGLIVSFYSYLVYDSYHFPTKQAEEALNYNTEDVYKINFGTVIMGLHEGDIVKVKSLFSKLGNIDGVSAWGGYYIDEAESISKLYVSPTLVSLCDLRTDGDDFVLFEYKDDSEYGQVYVGQNIADTHPVGSIYYDAGTECEYIVAGILKSKSRWLPGELLGASYVELDDAMVIDLDYTVSKPQNEIFIMNAYNNLLLAGHGDNIDEEAYNLAKQLGLDVIGTVDIGTMFSAYEKEAMDNAGEDYLLPFILLFSAVVVSVITSKMSVLANKRDYGIMISNGFTKAGLIGVVMVENIIKCLVAIIVCTIYWRIQYLSMDEFTQALYDDMILFKLFLYVIIFILVAQFPIRYLLSKKPYELINSKEL